MLYRRVIINSVITKTSEPAYIIGVALGDGNLSCPNGRAVRLRVTCDKRYPNIIKAIIINLEIIFPKTKFLYVSTHQKIA